MASFEKTKQKTALTVTEATVAEENSIWEMGSTTSWAFKQKL